MMEGIPEPLGVPSNADVRSVRSAASIDGQQKPWLQHVEATKRTSNAYGNMCM